MFTLSNAFFPYIGGPGLNVALDGGVVINNGSSTFIPAQTISVAANSTTFIFLNTSSIIIQSNTSGFTASNCYPIAIVTSSNTNIVTIQDMRPDIQGGGSGGGGGAVRWDQITNAAAPLTLANDGFATTFNQSTAVNWTWANTTAATSHNPTNSPVLVLASTIFNGSVSTVDKWTLQNIPDPTINNGTTALKLLHTGTAGLPMFSIGDVNSLSAEASAFFSNGSLNPAGPFETTMGYLQVFGHSQAGDTQALYVVNDYTPINDTVFGASVWSFLTNNTGSDSTDAEIALNVQAIHQGTHSVGTVTALTIATESDGTFTTPVGTMISLEILGNLSPVGGPLATNTYSIFLHDQNQGGVAGQTNYGIFFQPQTTTGGTTTWCIFESDSTCKNQLGPTTFLGAATFKGSSSGSAAISVAAAAGTPNTLVLPLSTGAANAVLTTDGNNPQQLSWTAQSALTVVWNNIQNATGALTLANANNATTFNQTSAVNWTWANTTAATSGVSQFSPIFTIAGQYWTGAASATDSWTIQNVIGTGTNGPNTLTFTHAGSTGLSTLQIIGNNVKLLGGNWSVKLNPTGTTAMNVQGIAVEATGHALGMAGNTTAGYVGLMFGNNSSFSATPQTTFGTQYGAIFGGLVIANTLNFTPASGATKIVGLGVTPNMNQTGTCTSDYTTFQVAMEERAFLGTNALLADFMIAAQITNAAEDAGSIVTLTVVNNKAIAGQRVFLEGLGTFTWLNGQTVTLTTASATSVTFTDPTTHGTQASVAQNGRIMLSQFRISSVGGLTGLGTWTQDNPIAATSGTSQSSPSMVWAGRYWTGAASATDSWTIQNVQTNGTNGPSVLTFTHSGSTAFGMQIPIGSVSTPAIDFSGANAGFYSTSGHIYGTNRSNALFALELAASGVNSGIRVVSSATLGWSSSGTTVAGNAADTGFTRLGAASVALGNGTSGDFTGSLKLGNETWTTAAPTVAAAQVGMGSTTATTATAGAQSLPASPAGFLIINVAGTTQKIPYYNN